jgi:maltooligosyltrehalose trehalohydrolase
VVIRRGGCVVAANLSSAPQTVSLRSVPSRVLLATEPGVVLQRDRVELPPESAVVVAAR